jgi:hypothetical protein
MSDSVQHYIDKIKYAPSLRALCEAVEEAEDFIYKNDLGALDSYIETSNLPTFGGEEPKENTSEIWSWDADELMVTGPDGDYAIVSREEWNS